MRVGRGVARGVREGGMWMWIRGGEGEGMGGEVVVVVVVDVVVGLVGLVGGLGCFMEGSVDVSA